MTEHLLIRCRLLAALLTVSALSVTDARANAARAVALAPTSSGSTRIALPHRSSTMPAPHVLDPYLFSVGDSIVAIALAQLGIPYVFGGATPGGFDCSGLVRYALSRVHMAIPRTARLQALVGAPVRVEQLERGDLLAFGVGDSITHVGIYVGDGRFVHASSAAGKVIVSAIDRPPSPLIRPMRGARRLLAAAEGSRSF